jgi:hypothetical protein
MPQNTRNAPHLRPFSREAEREAFSSILPKNQKKSAEIFLHFSQPPRKVIPGLGSFFRPWLPMCGGKVLANASESTTPTR